jgi:serine/threonine-protein kinase
VLRERGPRPLRRAIERHGQILSALSAAHRRGIIHCDLKPANLMFRRDADLPGIEVMLGDFGVAHLPDASGQIAAKAERAEAVGTLAYMAPEQRRGELSPAVDVYAAAVVLFENIAARTPWQNALMAGVRKDDDFRLPAHLVANADKHLVEAIQDHLYRLGAADPAKRPSTTQALAESQRLREQLIAAEAASRP